MSAGLSTAFGVVLLGACHHPPEADDSSDTDASDTDTNATGWDSDDPRYGLSADPACEERTDPRTGESSPVPGATAYWVMDADVVNGTLDGTYSEVVFANLTWEQTDTDAADCKVVYWLDSGAELLTPDGCDACEWDVWIGDAEQYRDPEGTLTNCPPIVMAHVADHIGDYHWHLDLAEDGSVTITTTAGIPFATGTLVDGHLHYTSVAECMWLE